MKSLLYTFFFFVAFASFSAQGQTTSQDLLGSWTFNYDESFTKMEHKSKSLLNRMSDIQKQRLESLYRNRVVQFQADGTYVQILSDGRTINRQWRIVNGQLIIEDGNGNSDAMDIIKVDSSTLILKPKNKGQAKALIDKWHFVKN